MKREIKFKGTRTDNGEYIYGSLICKEGYSAIIIFDKDMHAHYNAYLELEILPESVCQYTGLKDKNGKEIYERDIMENGYQIKWNFLHNCWGYFSKNGFQQEIISNVYDNIGKPTNAFLDLSIIGNGEKTPELMK